MVTSLLGAFIQSTPLTDAKSTRQGVEEPHAPYSIAAILTAGQDVKNANDFLWGGLYGHVENTIASLKTFVAIKALNTSRLTWSITPSTAPTGKTFAISGTLTNVTGGPITNQTIQLQKNVSGTWTDVSGKKSVTGATGLFIILLSENTAGVYEYRANFAGNAAYAGSSSASVVVPVQQPTQLTATTNLTIVAVNQPFTIYGTLSTANGVPISGETIQLQKNVSGTWTDVSGKTNRTSAAGSYSISLSEGTVGVYEYRANFVGRATNAGSHSASAVVTVKPLARLTASATPSTGTRGTDIHHLRHSLYC